MPDTTEAEARGKVWGVFEAHRQSPAEATLHSMFDQELDAYGEAVRATEREKVRGLVKRLTDDTVSPDDLECWFCGGNGWNKPDFDHTEDCPWVEARLWLDGGADA